jgi:hypothetical protein
MDFFRKFFKKEKRPEEIEVNEDTKKEAERQAIYFYNKIIENLILRLKIFNINISQAEINNLIEADQNIKENLIKYLNDFYINLIPLLKSYYTKILNINLDLIKIDDLKELENLEIEDVQKKEDIALSTTLSFLNNKLIYPRENIFKNIIDEFVSKVKSLMEENLDILEKIHNLVLKIQNKIKEYLKNKISNKEIENVSIEDIDSALPKLVHIDIIRPIILEPLMSTLEILDNIPGAISVFLGKNSENINKSIYQILLELKREEERLINEVDISLKEYFETEIAKIISELYRKFAKIL